MIPTLPAFLAGHPKAQAVEPETHIRTAWTEDRPGRDEEAIN
jgi:hypothetical protein